MTLCYQLEAKKAYMEGDMNPHLFTTHHYVDRGSGDIF